MEKLGFKKSAVLILCALPAVFVSCVNQDYDLSKEIDLNVSLFRDVALPIGNVQKIYIKDFLFSGDDSFITLSEDGNYQLELANGNFHEEVTVPSYTFEGFLRRIAMTLPVSDAGLPQPSGSFSGIVAMETMRFDFELHSDDFPEAVTGIYRCDISTDLTVSISSQSAGGNIFLAAGATVVFPDFLVLGDSVPQGLKKTGNNTFELYDDIPLFPSQEFKFEIKALDFSALPSGQGLVSLGHLSIDVDVTVSGNIGFDLSASLSAIKVNGTLQTGEIRLERAQASVSMEKDITLSPFEISGIPDFLKDDASVLDLRGLRLDMTADNSFPSGGTIMAGIRTFRDSYELADIQLAPVYFSHGTNSFSFSQNGTGAPEGYVNVRTENFDRLVKIVPDMAELYDFKMVTDDEPVAVTFGTPYSMAAGYRLSCPLCFGNEMEVAFSQDITGLSVDMSDFGLTSARLSLTAVNTIPMNFTIEAAAIDAYGEVIPGLDISLDGRISAGAPGSPESSELLLDLSSSSGPVAFDGLRLYMKTTSGSSIPLNAGQGLELNDLLLRLPEGVAFDLGNDDDE